LAGLAFIGARGSWLPDHSYESASIVLSNDILSEDEYGGRTSAPFAGIDGAWMRVDNDHSRVDIDGMNIMVGFASKERKKGDENHPDSSLLWAAFLDIGHADYDTYDSYSHVAVANKTVADIYGSGSLRSYGLGVMARKEWDNGFRVEGSLRGGKLKNEFSASGYELNGVPASYTVEAPYYGLHLGLGRTLKLNDPRDRLDLMFRYYWSRQEGETFTWPTGEWIAFDDDDSHRVRLGARFSRARDARRTWYIGAAVEHEFAGDIHARVERGNVFAPDLAGTTGIGEIGLILRPDADHNFSLETGIQGYIGKYRGFSAGVRFEWELD
jgi:outer membrane autotransporter protein